MNLIKKVLLKSKIELDFLLAQKYGITKLPGGLELPKYKLKQYLPKDPVIVDCGAHIGSDSVELSRIFQKGQIHSFEPVPDLYERLKRNTRRRSNISCYQLALSDKNGEAEMFVSSGSSDASSSLLAPTGHMNQHPEVKFSDTVSVETITIDSWAEKNKVDRVDFLWLDMQGFEMQMLSASTKILPTVKAIHTEVNTKELYKNSVLYADFRKWLESKGFVVKAELPNSVEMCNVLFVRK